MQDGRREVKKADFAVTWVKHTEDALDLGLLKAGAVKPF